MTIGEKSGRRLNRLPCSGSRIVPRDCKLNHGSNAVLMCAHSTLAPMSTHATRVDSDRTPKRVASVASSGKTTGNCSGSSSGSAAYHGQYGASLLKNGSRCFSSCNAMQFQPEDKLIGLRTKGQGALALRQGVQGWFGLYKARATRVHFKVAHPNPKWTSSAMPAITTFADTFSRNEAGVLCRSHASTMAWYVAAIANRESL